MNMQNLIWGLEELSDLEFQKRVWTGRSDGEMSTFEEAICATFDDSGLGIALDSERKRAELPSALCDVAMKLDSLVKKVPRGLSPMETISHPKMSDVREVAKKMLMILRT
jgi:hypothetical protein